MDKRCHVCRGQAFHKVGDQLVCSSCRTPYKEPAGIDAQTQKAKDKFEAILHAQHDIVKSEKVESPSGKETEKISEETEEEIKTGSEDEIIEDNSNEPETDKKEL